MYKLKLVTITVIFFSFFQLKAQQDTVKVIYYNLLNFPNVDPSRDVNDLKPIMQYFLPDILVVNELTSSSGANSILSNALNVNGINYYAKANFIDGPDTDNMLYYNSNKLGLKEQNQIPTTLRDHSEYVLYYKSPNIATTNDTTFFYVYSCHLKASQGNEQQRAQEAVTLKNYMNSRATNGENFIVGGDFNIYGASEQAFTYITSYGSIPLYDPINKIGEWHNNASYTDVFTQSTRTTSFNGGSTGGFDDRFDFIFINDDIVWGTKNVIYIPNSYKALGQDGLRFNQSLISPTNTSLPSNIINALYDMSDHLPVYAEFGINWINSSVDEITDENILVKYLPYQLIYKLIYPTQLQVFDLSGKEVLNSSLNNQGKYELNNLKSGMYIVSLKNEKGDFKYLKIFIP